MFYHIWGIIIGFVNLRVMLPEIVKSVIRAPRKPSFFSSFLGASNTGISCFSGYTFSSSSISAGIKMCTMKVSIRIAFG